MTKDLTNPLTNSLTDKSTKPEEFKPTPHMRLWLQTALQGDYETISDIAQACGIDRTTWYDWVVKPEFIRWYKEEWDKGITAHAWRLDLIGMKQAKRDFNYWKGMQNRVGNLIEKQGNTLNIGQLNVTWQEGESL